MYELFLSQIGFRSKLCWALQIFVLLFASICNEKLASRNILFLPVSHREEEDKGHICGAMHVFHQLQILTRARPNTEENANENKTNEMV